MRLYRQRCARLTIFLPLKSKYSRTKPSTPCSFPKSSPVLTEEVKASLLSHTYRLFETNFDCKVLKVNTDNDHIHILFSAKPQVQLSKLVNTYKTVTSRLLRKEFAEFLKPYYRKPYFWSRSYFICTVSDRSHDTVIAYIKNQGIN